MLSAERMSLKKKYCFPPRYRMSWSLLRVVSCNDSLCSDGVPWSGHPSQICSWSQAGRYCSRHARKMCSVMRRRVVGFGSVSVKLERSRGKFALTLDWSLFSNMISFWNGKWWSIYSFAGSLAYTENGTRELFVKLAAVLDHLHRHRFLLMQKLH